VELRFLYVGTSDTERDLASWLAFPGARLRWRFQHFGADVAAVEVGPSTALVLLADHRPAGSVLPIFAVDDLDAVGADLKATGWVLELGPMGTPEGPTSVWRNGNGTTIALLRVDRPGVMDTAYTEPGNTHAVRATSETP
jgi:hypothetical protein